MYNYSSLNHILQIEASASSKKVSQAEILYLSQAAFTQSIRHSVWKCIGSELETIHILH